MKGSRSASRFVFGRAYCIHVSKALRLLGDLKLHGVFGFCCITKVKFSEFANS